MKTSPECLALLKHYEGCSLTSYPDPGTGGAPWTIGYGSTGPDVRYGMEITQEEADRRLTDRLGYEFEPGVEKLLTIPATQCQFDSLVCLAYNIGLANLKASSVIRKHNLKDDAGAADAFRMWCRAAGKVMKGLQRRREAEWLVYLGAPADKAIKDAEGVYP